MAPAMKYAAAVALLMTSVSAIPLDIVSELKDRDEASIIRDLIEKPEGPYIEASEINYNAPFIHSSDVGNLTTHLGLDKRQAVDCANRPGNVNGIAICGPRFVDMGARVDDRWGPAVEAMPQFNHARYNNVERSCYPSFADNNNGNGDGPNAGISADAGVRAVGEGCVQGNPDGQSFSGPLMRSRPFPVYTDGVYCPADASWRIVYSLYYQNDYNHRHDWERAVVVFKKGGASDWWDRVALLLGQHSGYNNLKWSSATAHDDPYSSSPNRGQQGAHPRVFPGMYHHAIFNEAKTSCLGPGCATDTEYRRNSWQYTPTVDDIREGIAAVPAAWGDYDGKTTPTKAIGSVCGMSLS